METQRIHTAQFDAEVVTTPVEVQRRTHMLRAFAKITMRLYVVFITGLASSKHCDFVALCDVRPYNVACNGLKKLRN